MTRKYLKRLRSSSKSFLPSLKKIKQPMIRKKLLRDSKEIIVQPMEIEPMRLVGTILENPNILKREKSKIPLYRNN